MKKILILLPVLLSLSGCASYHERVRQECLGYPKDDATVRANCIESAMLWYISP